ncbi:BTAD domain-containing putative transcriptional regulator [Streptomyces sp. NPDC057445]|uniref:AfsR/SARP family transcriptional regulator n=1 Tax=Streptomyces sp. NPDC057445 TaxID=3346136 RepID=UPI0036779CB0
MTLLGLASTTTATATATATARVGAETEFRLLGPVGIHDGRSGAGVVPSGPKQRALLAALVTHAGELLCAGRLTEELWGARPPSNAPNALQAHVARLRRLLPGPGTHRAPGHEWISTLPTGYRLTLGRATTDVQRFEQLSAQGRAAVPSDPAHAVELLRRALSLWRGPALQDSRYGPLCTAEADRLEEKRLTTLETLYEASLSCAQHGEITGDLERLTADHPLRERFYDLLMVALYRSGRQAEALGVYERARRRLGDALGIEPGPVLRGRMEAILNQSPGLSVPHRAPAPAPAGPLTEALGLGDEIARLQRRIDDLKREQEALVRRFDAMTARLPQAS